VVGPFRGWSVVGPGQSVVGPDGPRTSWGKAGWTISDTLVVAAELARVALVPPVSREVCGPSGPHFWNLDLPGGLGRTREPDKEGRLGGVFCIS
jgi:hypothetical protein